MPRLEIVSSGTADACVNDVIEHCYGKTPLQTFIESATLAYDKLI